MTIFLQTQLINTVQRRLKSIDKLIAQSTADFETKASIYAAIAEHCTEQYQLLSKGNLPLEKEAKK